MTAENPAKFSPAEVELARYLQQGKTKAEIADNLGVTTSEAVHRTALLVAKLRATNRRDLLANLRRLTGA